MKAKILVLAVIALAICGPASAMKIYLNPSIQTANHSPDGAYEEGSNMQDVASRAIAKLQARGFAVRSSGWMDLGPACADSNAWGSACFIALHTDATGASGWVSNHGTKVFYSQNSDGSHNEACVSFADQLCSKLASKFAAFGRGNDMGPYADYPWCGWNMYVIAPWNTYAVPAVLIEGLYHDNYDDVYSVLMRPEGRDAYAQGVFEGVCDLYGWNYQGTPELYIEPRGQNAGYYSEDASGYWGSSAGWTGNYDSRMTSGGSRYFPTIATSPSGKWMQVNPILRVPGGTYQVDIGHYSNSYVSTDIVTSTSVSNCAALNGDLASGSTKAFQYKYGGMFVKAGDIRLNAGQTQPTIRFTYSSGNANDDSHRWNIEGFRFSLIPTASTLTLYTSTGGTVSGGGAKTSGDYVTAVATPTPGYRFVSWTTGAFNGTIVSTNASYSFVMPGQGYTLYANFIRSGTGLTATPCPSVGGTTTGSDGYTPGQQVTVTATANPGYTFTNWTSGSCGGTVVSTSPSYTFTMPSVDTTIYANFVVNSYDLAAVGAPEPGGTVTGSGTKVFGSSCTVTETPNPGFQFMAWKDSAGNTLSTSPSYTFNMPANDYTVYACYIKAIFYEGFEGRANGDIDMNHSGGPNASANGNKAGNPWFGADPTDCTVTGTVGSVTARVGSKMLYSLDGTYNCENAVNLAYRFNNGNPYTGGVYMDWYFYDPKGNSGGDLYRDYAGLTKYTLSPALSSTQDYDYSGTYNKTLHAYATQFLAIGASSDTSTGYDSTKYQIRVIGAPGSYANGWFNTSITRSVGWHHARILIGPAKTGGTNDVSFYIDGSAIATKDSVTTGGINSLSVYIRPNVTNVVSGYVDEITFGYAGTQPIERWGILGHYPWNSGVTNDPTRMSNDFIAPSGTTESDVWAAVGKSYNGKTWGSLYAPGGIVDFNKYYGATTEYGVSYLFTYIVNSGATITDADLTMGSDDGIKVFWNGSPVFTRDLYRGLTEDADHYGPLTIYPGVNRLMLKITQGCCGYQAQARLTKSNGTALTGLTYYTTDNVVPTGSVAINGGTSTTTSQTVTLTLSATDNLSGVGLMKFSNDNVNWSPAETYATSKTWTLSAGSGVKTVYVNYIDRALNSRTCSAQITHLSGAPKSKVGDLWSMPNGTEYTLQNKVVTGSTSGAFWVEEADRSAALKVMYGGAAIKNHAVNIVGSLDSSGYPRVFVANFVQDKGAATPITPLGIIGRWIGGTGINADTPGITDGKGLYNVGMLIRIAGAPKDADVSDPAKKFFYLDDGSGITDGNGHVGIKVICGSANPPSSAMVIVTGIVDLEVVGSRVVPVLVVRDPAEINPL